MIELERLTERWSDSVVKLKGCSNVYANVERKRAHIQNAIVRLAAYEDSGLMPDEVMGIIESKTEHGRWSVSSNGLAECSECGEPNLETKYCPHCGALMDLEGEN